MKKISLFSRIIFILQAFVVLYPIIWISARILKIEVDILLPIIMYGIYLAIPVAMIGVLLCLVLLVKQRNDKKEVVKNIMENTVSLNVPLVVDRNLGNNLYEAK